MKYSIDFQMCYQSNPCCHDVAIIKDDGTHEIKRYMKALDILDLIINNNIPISVKDFKHFEYCYCKPEHHNYLEMLLKNENKNEIFCLCVNPELLDTLMHKHPQICYNAKVTRTALHNNTHLIKGKKIYDSSYILSTEILKEKIPSYHLHLMDIIFIKNGKKIYPEEFQVIFKGVDFTFIGKCMKDYIKKYNMLVSYPLLIDEDIEVNIFTEDVDEIYFQVISTPFGELHNKLDNYWRNNRVPVISHVSIYSLDNIKGYFNKIYLYSDDFSNIKSIRVTNNDVVFVDNVIPVVLEIENNLLCIDLSCGDHGLRIKETDEFKIEYKLYDENTGYDIMMYGERRALFGRFNIID